MKLRRRDRRLLAEIHDIALTQYRKGVLDSAKRHETQESLKERRQRFHSTYYYDRYNWSAMAYNHGYKDQAYGNVSNDQTLKPEVWSDVYMTYLLGVATEPLTSPFA
jgi:hypothetical protein